MTDKDKAAQSLDGGAALNGSPNNIGAGSRANDTKRLKWRATLAHLLAQPVHRFQAEGHGDHALPSTVSALERIHGLKIERDWTEVPNRFGTHTRVKRYWIADASRALAMELLGAANGSGGAK